MSEHSLNFYHAAIKNACPQTIAMSLPEIQGVMAKVFLAEQPDASKIVCKFNPATIIKRNKHVSELMRECDIPMPVTTTHAYLDTYFESYRYIPDKTLYEYMRDGVSDEFITNAFKQAIDVQHQISQITPDEVATMPGRTFADVTGIQMSEKVRPILAMSYKLIATIMAQGGKMRLLHSDLQPKNILVTPNGNLSHVIDIESVVLCNDSFAMLRMLYNYPLNNTDDIMDYYEQTTGRTLNRRLIHAGLKILPMLYEPKKRLDNIFTTTHGR